MIIIRPIITPSQIWEYVVEGPAEPPRGRQKLMLSTPSTTHGHLPFLWLTAILCTTYIVLGGLHWDEISLVLHPSPAA